VPAATKEPLAGSLVAAPAGCRLLLALPPSAASCSVSLLAIACPRLLLAVAAASLACVVAPCSPLSAPHAGLDRVSVCVWADRLRQWGLMCALWSWAIGLTLSGEEGYGCALVLRIGSFGCSVLKTLKPKPRTVAELPRYKSRNRTEEL
jgi:hypothetical protein